MGQACAYIKSADMNTEYFVPVHMVTFLSKSKENGKDVFYMYISGDEIGIKITEMDYNDLIQMMKG